MRKIAVVTGTRAEYGILLPVLRAIQARPELSLSVVVTGMHLSREFGHTVRDIENDGFPIAAEVDMLLSSDTSEAMAKSVGLGILGMAQTWRHLRPDVVLVLGDRVEPLAGAISSAYMNIPVAHIHGGDSSRGGLDEYARHAITKFAHIHFPGTPRSAERILKMGEDEWRIHMVGSPALDAILNEKPVPDEVLIEKLGIDPSKPPVLVVQHPVTTEVENAGDQMAQTLEAVIATGYPAIALYPNSDAGGREMIEVIREYEKRFPVLRAIPSLPRAEYLGLMKLAKVLVGNSSSGIIDAPSFGVPAVNIGTRQEGRERGKNVIDVGYGKEEIVQAIKRAMADEKFLAEVGKCESPYGDGKAGGRIAQVLSSTQCTPELLQKKITY
ncbi:MAG: UDP-N-acetylglucosamine 2-epimerase (hydrolyzing) [Chloroflexi bacterium]|nr:UDP-N-acetylglucosamine 2-epimerase (hydrolyzing) [Chloroflexota bacterium]